MSLVEMIVAVGLVMLIVPLVANLLPLGQTCNKKARALQVAGDLGGVLVEEGIQGDPDVTNQPRTVGEEKFQCWRTTVTNAQGLRDITVRVEHPRLAPVRFVTRVPALTP